MKKIGLAVLVAATMLTSCGGGKKAENNANQDAVVVGESLTIIDESNAKNSLDWAGTYKGILPAADAEGLDVTITLAPDSSFTKTYSYVGKKNDPVTETGKYLWSEDGNIVILQGVTAPNQYFVSEGEIIQLDTNGNRITGDLAKKQVLNKIAE